MLETAATPGTIKVLCMTEDLDRPTAATLAGLAAAGVAISVISPQQSPRRGELAAAGVRVLEKPLAEWVGRRNRPALRAELERGGYDIVHLFGNRPLQHGLGACRGLPVKIVAYRGIVGNVSFVNPVSWMRVLNPRIDRIVCVADAVRDYFLRMRPAWLRVPPERLVRIYKGHSPDWYTDPRADLAACGVPDDAFVVGCTANYRPRKGIEYLVDALAHLPAEWNVRLILVGRMDAPALARRIAASPAASRIHRLGMRADAPALAAACDAFVLPSIKREGLARSLIEAMAYGVPPIVTDCGGSPELVANGECGIVVPVRDAPALAAAIRRLYLEPDLRRRFGDAARRRIGERFRVEDTIAQTLALYRALLDEPRGC